MGFLITRDLSASYLFLFCLGSVTVCLLINVPVSQVQKKYSRSNFVCYSIRQQSSLESAGVLGLAEKQFLQKAVTTFQLKATEYDEQKMPTLDDFEAKLSDYQVSISL